MTAVALTYGQYRPGCFTDPITSQAGKSLFPYRVLGEPALGAAATPEAGVGHSVPTFSPARLLPLGKLGSCDNSRMNV